MAIDLEPDETCDKPEYEAEHEGWSTATVCIHCGWLINLHDPASVLAREKAEGIHD